MLFCEKAFDKYCLDKFGESVQLLYVMDLKSTGRDWKIMLEQTMLMTLGKVKRKALSSGNSQVAKRHEIEQREFKYLRPCSI